MRIVNAAGRLGLLTAAGVVDVATASGGRFSHEVQHVYDRWPEFRQWAEGLTSADFAEGLVQPLIQDELGSPAPQPRQVFAIGLNYRDHAEESGTHLAGDAMVVFTKYPSSIAGPSATVELPEGSVDFEAELVVVMAQRAYRVEPSEAWNYVAGLTIGQDLSEREMQLRPPTPQFSLSKSFPGFSPMGPALVSADEFDNPDDLELGCSLNGTPMQQSRTRFMIFSVPQIIARLSATLPLEAGDVIFTGTPAGIGWAREPKVLLHPGDELVTTVETIGSMRTRFSVRPRRL